MRFASQLRHVAILLPLLAPVCAGAQSPPPTPDILQAQLRDWLARQVGPTVDLSLLQLRVLAEGDAFRIELPFGGSPFGAAVALSDGALAATVQPIEGGRWRLRSLALPSPIRAELTDPGSGAVSSVAITIDGQEASGDIDPELAAPSTATLALRGYNVEVRTPTGQQSTRIERFTSRAEWQPTTDGRVTIMGDSTMDRYSSTSPLPGIGMLTMRAERMGGTTRFDNFDVAAIGGIVRAALSLGSAVRDAAPAPGAKSESRKTPGGYEKELAHGLLARLGDLLDGIEADYRYEGLAFEAGAFGGSLRKLGIGFGLAAPEGKADIRLRLALEGLESPMIPEGVWRDYLPHQVTLSPRLSGVPKAALMAFLGAAIDSEGKSVDEDGKRLFAETPISFRLEDVLIDLGPLRIKGAGGIEMTGLDAITGEAELRATGVDAMIRRANTTPELKMAAPVLIFLKGISRQDGADLVWTITYRDQKMLVNDTDLSDIVPIK